MIQRHLSIEYRPLTSVRLAAQNPRIHTKKQIRQIAQSIETFGFIVPVLIDGQEHLIAGHGRFLAAQLLGITQVPTIMLEHLTEAQIRAFMIADNRLTENSVWEDRLLAEQLKALSALELDFSVDVTGFEMREIDMRIEGVVPDRHIKNDPADAIPEVGTKPRVTCAGDLWVLGPHRLYCGDARDDSAYSPLMVGRQAKIIFTDPPCNGPTANHVTELGKTQDQKFGLASSHMREAEYTDLLKNTLAPLAHHSVDGSLHFICVHWRFSGELLTAARSVYTEFKDVCVWVKDESELGPLYRSQHELIFVFRYSKTPDGGNCQPDQRDGHRSNVWRYRRPKSLSRKRRKGTQSTFGATIKPVELIADAILDWTASGDVVLDPFLGRGTTLIAAECTGRTCYGIELDPRYVDTTVRRWQAFTGKNAIQESTGRTFSEMEEENHGRND